LRGAPPLKSSTKKAFTHALRPRWSKDGQSVDARSIMGLMMLAGSLGSDIEIAAEGPDAEEAMVAILALVEAKFGED
jgi:phosphotransferase system HPr (HPr) family protein